MLGEAIRILMVAGDDGRDYYRATLFAPAEAVTRGCTARGGHLHRGDRGGTDDPAVHALAAGLADRQ